MKPHYHVSFITAAEALPLRQKVLRPLLRPEDCFYKEDDLATSFHLGLFHAGRLVCIATFMLEASATFHAGHPYRLRGMATDPRYRGQGFGGILLRQGIEVLKDRRCDLLWFNAREAAFPFYESLGFQYHGGLFEMPGIGPHKVMYKHLIPR